VRGGALPVVTQQLHSPALAVRAEAAYAVANMCLGGRDGCGSVAALCESVGRDEAAMRAFMDLLASLDWTLVMLALRFAELVCKLIGAEGTALVERCGGLDAIETLAVAAEVPADVCELAAALQSRFFTSDSC